MSNIDMEKLIAQSRQDGYRQPTDVKVPIKAEKSNNVNRSHNFGLNSDNQYLTEQVDLTGMSDKE